MAVINILWVQLFTFVKLLKGYMVKKKKQKQEKIQSGELCLDTWHNCMEVFLLGEELVCACMCK